jgi:hypothetical protein
MPKLMLVLNFTMRAMLLAIVLSAVLGALFPCLCTFNLLAPLYYGPLGAGIGLLVGVPLGAFSGLIMGLVTVKFFDPLENEKQYRKVMLLTAVAITLPASLLGFLPFFPWYQSYTQESWRVVFLAGTPAVIATIAAAVAAHWVSTWYIESQKQDKKPDE